MSIICSTVAKFMKVLPVRGFCCANSLGDPFYESSVIAGRRGKLGADKIPDHELVVLQ